MPYLRNSILLSLASAVLFGQALQPQPPGPSVAGRWTGRMTMILAAGKREVTLPLDFVFQQDGNNVKGTLTMRGNRTIPATGIEENGRLNLLWDFNESEHCRVHLTLEGETLSGPLFNFHDNPQKWDVDETGTVTITRAK